MTNNESITVEQLMENTHDFTPFIIIQDNKAVWKEQKLYWEGQYADCVVQTYQIDWARRAFEIFI